MIQLYQFNAYYSRFLPFLDVPVLKINSIDIFILLFWYFLFSTDYLRISFIFVDFTDLIQPIYFLFSVVVYIATSLDTQLPIDRTLNYERSREWTQ